MNIRQLYNSKNFTVAIHVLIWGFILLVPLIFIESPQERINYIVIGWFLFLLIAGFFYLNYFVLIPGFFLEKKIFLYALFLLIGLAVIGLLNMGYHYFLSEYYFIHRAHHPPFSRFFFFPVYPGLLAIAVGLSIRITGYWLKAEKQKKEMENEKLISELAFLKSQVNPHFLFNVLNNICSLARKKSDDTENAIIKLSQIMRYMLSDSKEEKVGLEKEVEYLKNYIELQRLRISDKVEIRFDIEGSPETKMIEPMLLIPFVENAFKHGVSYMEDSRILINLKILDDRLIFSVINRIRKKDNSIPVGSGIGLKNIIRRLELLYPENHNLSIRDDGLDYFVNLEILTGK